MIVITQKFVKSKNNKETTKCLSRYKHKKRRKKNNWQKVTKGKLKVLVKSSVN